MNASFKSFVIKLIILSVIMGVLVTAAVFFGSQKYISPTLPFILIFFIVLSLFVGNFLIKAVQSDFNKFYPQFMSVTFIKMMGSIVLMGIYAYLYREDAMPFVLDFAFIYLIFTFFEIKTVLKLSSKKR